MSQVLAYAKGAAVVCPPCATPAEVQEEDKNFVVILKSDEWKDEVVYVGVPCIRCGKRYDEAQEEFR